MIDKLNPRKICIIQISCLPTGQRYFTEPFLMTSKTICMRKPFFVIENPKYCDEHPESVDVHAAAPGEDTFTQSLGSTVSLSCNLGYRVEPEGELMATCEQHTSNSGIWTSDLTCIGASQGLNSCFYLYFLAFHQFPYFSLKNHPSKLLHYLNVYVLFSILNLINHYSLSNQYSHFLKKINKRVLSLSQIMYGCRTRAHVSVKLRVTG